MADVWDSELDGETATHVMAVLANSADDDGTNCFPGNRLIARRARVSERTVIRTIKHLAEDGWLWIVQRGGSGAGHRTEYRLNVNRLHEQAERTRDEERARRQGCHRVTLRQPQGRVTTRRNKGDTGAGKGDIDVAPLFVLPVNDTSLGSDTPYPLPREGEREYELGSAVDQVCSALGIANRRKRGPVKQAIAMAAEKGELPATIALAMIAAVRTQDQLHLDRKLKFKYGLEKFLGLGIWRDENRWAWDTEELDRQAQARVGSR